ncbi:MAG: cardiolipin synthase [Halomonadaceae bacterium]|nr:MAG: cardiolipin synthase [Halomonadaceae bacterium]
MQWFRRHRLLFTFLALAHTIGLVSSLDALMSARTAPGAVAWIVSLNTMPYVAVPAYWVFGRTKFQGYVIARRDLDSQLAVQLADHINRLRTHRLETPYQSKDLRAVEALAKVPFVTGNSLELLIDGEAAFESILSGMADARDYILVQFYIIKDDELGRKFKQVLIDQARKGVAVHLLYDEIGSHQLPNSYIQALTEAGVNVHRFHSTRGRGNRLQLNFRNHRKVVVVDGQQGWLGGLNVGDEYLGRHEQIGPWRDTHLRIEGPAVQKMQLSFVEDWHWATESILALPWEPRPSDTGNIPTLILASGPADRFDTASLMIQQAIHAAQERFWISSPYFVPDEGVQGMLKLAALGGVDVRILIPEQSDFRLVDQAAHAFIEPLLQAGVRIYRYQDGFLHGKAFLVDTQGAAVGTVNLDNRSFRLNFEITAIAIDEDFAADVEGMFLEDFARSRPMQVADREERTFWSRLLSRAAYLFAPVL